MMDTSHQSCAFTGHRPASYPWKYDEQAEACKKLKAVLFSQIKALAEAGVTHFLSGMAQGADLWAAQAVLALREANPALNLHCILPCEGQADKWPPASQQLYHSILVHSNSTVYTSRAYYSGCMLARNRYLAEHAFTVLAVYNGDRRSGTAATLRYAYKLNREILLIDPVTRNFRRIPPTR